MKLINAMTANAGVDSVGSSKSIFAIGAIITEPMITSAGPYAAGGIAVTSGAKKSDGTISAAMKTAVNPVRPPACTPAADSMNAPEVVVPASAANTVANASQSMGCAIRDRLPRSSRNPAREETPIKEPIVSINAMTKIESRTPKNRKFSTAERSALNIIGAGFGGVPIHAPGPGTMPLTNATIDAARIPSRMAPGTRRRVKTAIARNLKIANQHDR